MSLKKQLIIKQLIKSFTLVKKAPLKLSYPVLIDLSFLFIYGFFSWIFTSKILYYFYSIYELMLKNTETFKSSFLTKGFFSAVAQTPGADVSIKKSILWILVLVIFIYFSYSFFQALSWRFSINFVKHKKIKDYMKKFFLVNLFWLLFFIIYNIISISLGFRKHIIARYAEVADFSIVLFIFIIIWFYFMLISYSLIERYTVWKSIKRTFIIGTKKIKSILAMYFVIFILFFMINYIMMYFGKINQKIALVIGFFIVLPLFAFIRLYIYLVVTDLARTKV